MKQNNIRKVILDDIVILENLSRECFIVPFNRDVFLYELNENEFSNIVVYEENNKIVAYLIYWVTFDSSTVVQIGVTKDYRKKGIASSLMDYMFEDLKNKEVLTSTLEVRASNSNAISLYEKLGYIKVTIKKNYYSDNGEDALYMMKGIY